MKALSTIDVRPVVPDELSGLLRLAKNLRWTWKRDVQDLFAQLDARLWIETRGDPLAVLRLIPQERLQELARDEGFRGWVAELDDELRTHLSTIPEQAPDGPRLVAYFSPEFGVSSTLPQYSGGLGILAGDHLKAASDLGVPLVAVGLLYGHGYFRQSLSADGRQQERYSLLRANELPLDLVLDGDHRPVTVEIGLPTTRILARIWRAQVGRVSLLLLDTDLEENDEEGRTITDRLYGGSVEHRLKQEILLGIGGVRALEACGYDPEVFHMNEGHAGFLGLERMSRLIGRGVDRDTALAAVRAATVFTTHTPVPAGIDRFSVDLVERFICSSELGLDLPSSFVVPLGREPAEQGAQTVFNMACMGLRLGQRCNGVSALHGVVSREMFASMWPGFEARESPIGHITNGVHAGTWISAEAASLFGRHLGSIDSTDPAVWERIRSVPDEEIWSIRRQLRQRLVTDVRRRVREAWAERGAHEKQLGWVESVLDPDVLTIGFARRVPSYKRLTLILRERERLTRLLLDADRPVQFVIAGKAHPADDLGKQLISELVNFAADPRVRHRITFLPDYDMTMASTLVAGVDVWLNNPLRPYEACGTSGMKAALNGVLNLSILDGWWDELYDGRNGWAIPSADDGSLDPDARDAAEAAAILDLLENTIRPLFYDRPDGLARAWIDQVKHCIATLGPAVQATRMLTDYVDRLYTPAARASRAIAGDDFAGARSLAAYAARARRAFPGVSLADRADGATDLERGQRAPVSADVRLGSLDPEDVLVQVLYGSVDDDGEIPSPVLAPLEPEGAAQNGTQRYASSLPLDVGGVFGYTVRVIPRHEGLAAPSELGLVAWA
jgi:glycogen phosphorylase